MLLREDFFHGFHDTEPHTGTETMICLSARRPRGRRPAVRPRRAPAGRQDRPGAWTSRRCTAGPSATSTVTSGRSCGWRPAEAARSGGRRGRVSRSARHQADAGPPVQQVVDVDGALVGDPEDQLRQRGRQVRRPGASSSSSARPVTRRALSSTSGASVPKRRTSRAGASTRASSARGAAPSSGRSRVRQRPVARPVASTASSAIRRYVVSLPPTTVTTPLSEVSTACRRDRSAVVPSAVEQRPQPGVRPDHVAAAQRPLERGGRPRRAGSRSRPRSARGRPGPAPSTGSSVRPT